MIGKRKRESLKQIQKEQRLKELELKRAKKARKSMNREYAIVCYFFVGIFVALIGYTVYFNLFKSEEFINSPYNTRQNTFADRVVRGSVISSDGEKLAYTKGEGEDERRIYPYENMFAHVLGYTVQGKSGLESILNFDLLTSHEGYLEQMTNEFKEQKNQGDNVVTTLNAKLQETAYHALGSCDGAIVVMEPDTGNVLAMVSKPDFDPNTIGEDWNSLISDDSNSSLLNRATQGAYPPGSTYKIVTALAYLRTHGNLDGFSFDCEGQITENDHTIHCYNDTVHGTEDLPLAFAKSCNSAFAQIGLKLGDSALKSTSEEMLFNKKLPIELNYRKSRFTLDASSGKPLLMQTAIGQGDTLVSPMHMAMIVSAIANDGVLMEPQFIEQVENYNGGKVRSIKPSGYKRLMTQSEANALSQLMEGVVQDGTAAKLNNDRYQAAGKTGSAEYDQNGTRKTHSWFVGYAGNEKPEIVVSIIAEGAGTGSEVAVPIAKKILDAWDFN